MLDNGPKFTGKTLFDWSKKLEVSLDFIRQENQWKMEFANPLTGDLEMNA